MYIYIWFICGLYIQGVPNKCIYISNKCFFNKFNFQNVCEFSNFIVLSPSVLKLTSILVQTRLTTRSNGIAHITNNPLGICVHSRLKDVLNSATFADFIV